jgi:hypothetical protein
MSESHNRGPRFPDLLSFMGASPQTPGLAALEVVEELNKDLDGLHGSGPRRPKRSATGMFFISVILESFSTHFQKTRLTQNP